MKITFHCPHCHQRANKTDHGRYRGFSISSLACTACGTWVPVVSGFALFPQASQSPFGLEVIRSVVDTEFRTAADYADFIYQQTLRPVFDPYAAYYPFNEALQGFTRFTDRIRSHLEPGDIVLDLNARTGWTGCMLAALLPEQHVVSLWEGNRGLLGYSGFSYWLGEDQRASNLEFAFVNNREQLPFADSTFRLVFGFDFLHYHLSDRSLEELFRVAGHDAPLVFPHVHTSHSEPDPWFERGGTLMDAGQITARIDRCQNRGARFTCVLSELDVFNRSPLQLETPAHIQHYNCLVLCAPQSWQGKPLQDRGSGEYRDTELLFPHPLVEFDLNHGHLQLNPHSMENGVQHLLDRHPAIEDEIRAHLLPPLTRHQRQVIYLARNGLNCREIRERIDLTAADMQDLVHDLFRRRLALGFPLPDAVWRLQHYLGHRTTMDSPGDHVFSTLWQRMDAGFTDHPLILNHDGSAFDSETVRLFVNATRNLFAERKVSTGDAILVSSDIHLEVFIICWAAWLEGIVVILLDPTTPLDVLSRTIETAACRLMISDRSTPAPADFVTIVLDDPATDDAPDNAMSRMIEPWLDHPAPDIPKLDQSHPALVLGTSGNTGQPKLVQLSHGSLFRSSHSLSQLYQWQRSDILLSMGPAHSMSGIRNPAWAALGAGVTTVVPSPSQQKTFTGALGLIDQFHVTVVCAVPAFIDNLASMQDHGRLPALPSLRQILSTASPLDEQARSRLQSLMGAEILDYYGLTETGGLCVGQHPGEIPGSGVIGKCINCIAEIRDPNGEGLAPGQQGQLWVYGMNHMLGYVGENDSGVSISDGWLATGDLARFLPGGDIVLLGRMDGATKNRQGEFVMAPESNRIPEASASDADSRR